MAQQKTITYNGVETAVEEMDTVSSQEPWSYYLLEDGTNLKLKNVVLKVYRVVGQFTSLGDPVYYALSQQLIDVVSHTQTVPLNESEHDRTK